MAIRPCSALPQGVWRGDAVSPRDHKSGRLEPALCPTLHRIRPCGHSRTNTVVIATLPPLVSGGLAWTGNGLNRID